MIQDELVQKAYYWGRRVWSLGRKQPPEFGPVADHVIPDKNIPKYITANVLLSIVAEGFADILNVVSAIYRQSNYFDLYLACIKWSAITRLRT